MNDRELRLECVRMASENLRALIGTGPIPYKPSDMANIVSERAERLFDYIWTGDLKAAA